MKSLLHYSMTQKFSFRIINDDACHLIVCSFVTWLLLSNSQATSLIWAAHTVSFACCDHPHRSFCQFRCTTWTLLHVVSLLLLRDFGTLSHWTVELLHPLTHLRSILRHFSLIPHNRTVARTSVLRRDINWLIDWLIDCSSNMTVLCQSFDSVNDITDVLLVLTKSFADLECHGWYYHSSFLSLCHLFYMLWLFISFMLLHRAALNADAV